MGKIRGEYWITDSGYVEYADGDVGDRNHEFIVMQHCVSLVLTWLGGDYDESTDFEEEVEKLIKEDDETLTSFEEWAKTQTPDLFAPFTLAEAALSGPNYNILDRALGRGDLKEFAVRRLKWIWVRSNYAGMDSLKDRDTLISGLSEIEEQEGVESVEWHVRVYMASHTSATRQFVGSIEELKTAIPAIEVSADTLIPESGTSRAAQIESLDKAQRHECYSTGSE